MARQEVYALTETPVQLNAADRQLGEAGQGLQLVNIGDDPISWRLSSARPDGPGFRIDPLANAWLSVSTVGMWAWSVGRSRLLVLPAAQRGGNAGVLPTVGQTLGSSPVALAWPAGMPFRAEAVIRNVGPRPALRYWGSNTPDPDAVDAVPIPPGGDFPATDTGPDGDGEIYVWSDRHAGTELLVQHRGADWWSF